MTAQQLHSMILTSAIDIPNGIWHLTLFAGLIACMWVFIVQYRERIGWAATLLWAYCLASAIYILEFPAFKYGVVDRAFGAWAGQSAVECLFIPLGALVLGKKLWKVLTFIVALEIAMLWLQPCGLFKAVSFDTAFLALCMPFMTFWVALVSIITIAFHHGETAILMIAAQALIILYRRGALFKFAWLGAPIGLGLIAWHAISNPVGASLYGGATTRLEAYVRFMAFWATDWKQIVLGVGAGTFMGHSLMIDQFQNPIWLELHSDWLQILFEDGAVGFVLAVCVYWRALKMSKSAPALYLGVVSAGVFMLTYHPLRFFPSALAVSLIGAQALSYSRR